MILEVSCLVCAHRKLSLGMCQLAMLDPYVIIAVQLCDYDDC